MRGGLNGIHPEKMLPAHRLLHPCEAIFTVMLMRSLAILVPLLCLALAACSNGSSSPSMKAGYSTERTGTSTMQDEWHRDPERY